MSGHCADESIRVATLIPCSEFFSASGTPRVIFTPRWANHVTKRITLGAEISIFVPDSWIIREKNPVDAAMKDIVSLDPHFIVASQTPFLEHVVRRISPPPSNPRPYHPLIARFSQSYGGNSKDTGFAPREIGYNLDLPPDFNLLRELMDSCLFRNGLIKESREELREAIRNLNLTVQFKPRPITIINL